MLLSGYINKYIEGLAKKEYQRLLLILLGVFSLFPTLFYFEISMDNGKGLIQMIMIYLVGRYIRLHKDIELSKRKTVIAFAGLWMINGLSHEIPIELGGIYHHLCKDNSITNITMAILLF